MLGEAQGLAVLKYREGSRNFCLGEGDYKTENEL